MLVIWQVSVCTHIQGQDWK